MHADDSSNLSFTLKLSTTRSVNGHHVLSYGDTQSKSIYPEGSSELCVLVITELNLFHSFLNSFRNNNTSGLIKGKKRCTG